MKTYLKGLATLTLGLSLGSMALIPTASATECGPGTFFDPATSTCLVAAPPPPPPCNSGSFYIFGIGGSWQNGDCYGGGYYPGYNYPYYYHGPYGGPAFGYPTPGYGW